MIDLQAVTKLAPAFGKFIDGYMDLAAKINLDDNPNREAAFLAQCAHESNGFTALEEGLNYSAQGLANTWPNRYALKDAAGEYVKGPKGEKMPNSVANRLARNPQAIANNAYANRMGNGDEKSGDGWRYRGRGWKQVTGKDNYRTCSLKLFNDPNTLLNNPDMLATPAYAPASGGWYWDTHKLNDVADKGTLAAYEAITRRINGGLLGHDKRVEWLNKICAAAGVAKWK